MNSSLPDALLKQRSSNNIRGIWNEDNNSLGQFSPCNSPPVITSSPKQFSLTSLPELPRRESESAVGSTVRTDSGGSILTGFSSFSRSTRGTSIGHVGSPSTFSSFDEYKIPNSSSLGNFNFEESSRPNPTAQDTRLRQLSSKSYVKDHPSFFSDDENTCVNTFARKSAWSLQSPIGPSPSFTVGSAPNPTIVSPRARSGETSIPTLDLPYSPRERENSTFSSLHSFSSYDEIDHSANRRNRLVTEDIDSNPHSGIASPSFVSDSVTPTPSSLAHASSNIQEEISTIFVIGFPDDMREREFCNMFLFAKGFEGALLKYPQGHKDSVTPVTPPVSGHPEFPNASQSQEDLGFSRLTLDSETEREEKSPTPPLTNIPRRQTIGFAKFKTRALALEATEILNGKRVDFVRFGLAGNAAQYSSLVSNERIHVLRAEMAKKNLNPKRPLPQLASPPTSNGLTSGHNLAINTISSPSQPQFYAGATPTSATFPAHVLDNKLLRVSSQPKTVTKDSLESLTFDQPRERERERSREAMDAKAYEAFHSVPSCASTSSSASSKSTVMDNSSLWGQFSPTTQRPSSPDRRDETPFQKSDAYRAEGGRVYSFPPARTETVFVPPFENQQQPPFEETRRSQTTGPGPFGYGFSQNVEYRDVSSPPPEAFPPVHGRGYMSFRSQSNANSFVPPVRQSTSLRAQNPADMNSPKNTLYIGGLPANVTPEEGSALQTAIETTFKERCPKFKRMSFRLKTTSSGSSPIVFCEFEDTESATQAMDELYGDTLRGHPLLQKAGIRLSYSKNPLGVRSTTANNLSSIVPPPPPPHNHKLHQMNVPASATELSFSGQPPFNLPSDIFHRRPSEPVFPSNFVSGQQGGFNPEFRSPTAMPFRSFSPPSGYPNFSRAT